MSLEQTSTFPWNCITTTTIDVIPHLLWILLLKDAIVLAWKNENYNQAYPKLVPRLRFSIARKDQDLPFRILHFFREWNSKFSSDFFGELVFVKIDNGISNCNSNSTYIMNIYHICMQIITRSGLVIVPISIQNKTIKSYVFNCWVQIVDDNNRTISSFVNTCHVSKKKVKQV
jgi:hypothetical protein